METNDIFKDLGVKVKLKGEFGQIREVLTRIGIANYQNKVMVQTAHIFHKQGEYAIMHFKEMFLFDNKSANFSNEDQARRNRIVKMLEEWGLVEVLDDIEDEPIAPNFSVNVINRKQKLDDNWQLVAKYTIGKSGQ